MVESNGEQGAVSITFSAIDSEGHTGRFVKEFRPLSYGKGNVGNGVSIHQMMAAIHRARLCTSQAIVQVPAPPGQDLDAASGEGRGGGARGSSAGASAQAASADAPAAEPADGTMVDDAPDARAQGAAVDDESSKLRQGLAALAVKPGARNHLVVIGNDLDSQFGKATRLVPNQEYSPIVLEHSGGFQRIVSLLTKENPGNVGELVIVIGDAEVSSIRALPLTSHQERTVADRKVEGLLGTIVAAVEIGLDLQNKPDVSIYVWDELKQGPDQVTLSESFATPPTSRCFHSSSAMSTERSDPRWKPSGSFGMPTLRSTDLSELTATPLAGRNRHE